LIVDYQFAVGDGDGDDDDDGTAVKKSHSRNLRPAITINNT